MKNLAGVLDCDRDIRRELERCRIDIVEVPSTRSEVPYTIVGSLAGWTFTRAWYYWMAKGELPLEVAQKLYADPVGKTDIRVAGHCGCPPPEPPWIAYFAADGAMLLNDPDGKEAALCADFLSKGIFTADQMTGKRFVPDAAAVAARAVVTSYHIDTEVGLRLFADTLRALPGGV